MNSTEAMATVIITSFLVFAAFTVLLIWGMVKVAKRFRR